MALKSSFTLESRYAKFLQNSFPPDSDDETLSQIRAELAEYDSYVVGHVETAIHAGLQSACHVRVDDHLRVRLVRFLSCATGALATDAERLLAYLLEIEELIRLLHNSGP